MKNLLKRSELLEVLREGNFGSYRFRRAVEQAYLSSKFVVYRKGNNVYFEQGSGRFAIIPMDIVEDIIGTEIHIESRAA